MVSYPTVGRMLAMFLAAAFLLVPQSFAEKPKHASKMAAGAHKGIEVGHPAPDFTLKAADGKSYHLADLKGKNVVLVWMNPDCPVSKADMDKGTVNAAVDKYAGKNVVILQIDSTGKDGGASTERSKMAIDKWKLKAPVLEDFDGTVGHQYGAKTTPHVFVIDAEGKLAYKGAIDNKESAGKAKEGAINYIDATLDALLAGKTPAVQSTQPYGCAVHYAKPKA